MRIESTEITLIDKGLGECAEIVRAEAHGGRILLLTEEGRAGDDIAAALALAGLTVTRRDLSERILGDYGALTRIDAPEGIMAAVGAGGIAAMECAKGVGLPRSVPRLLIPLDLSALVAFDDRAFFGTKGDVLSLVTEDAHVLFDKETLSSSGQVRTGLGILLAWWVERLDAVYEALIERETCPSNALNELKRAVKELATIRESDAAKGIAELALAWTQGANALGNPRSTSAHLLAMLAAKSSDGDYTDYLFSAAYALMRLYARYLGDLPLEHAAPPDRARNVELLEKRCSLSPSPLLTRAKTYAADYERRTRVTAEYREDFAETLSESTLASLSRVYRRSRKSESESPLPPPTALLALLSLTGEAVSGYPIIKHIKTTGLLEPLLVAG